MRCPACATDNAAAAVACSKCGAKLAKSVRRKNSDPGVYTFANVPVPENPRAVLAYHCAIYGMIPVAGLFLGSAALALGVVGYCRARKDPAKKGIGHAITGMLLGSAELLTNAAGLVFVWIGIQSLMS
ncbi:MAG: hypothetical protein K2R98_16120 [Gemmataceae bacterium]|nr:hypothetical protein [Gemmataceae bacterium]